jgi:hypothetical protein
MTEKSGNLRILGPNCEQLKKQNVLKKAVFLTKLLFLIFPSFVCHLDFSKEARLIARSPSPEVYPPLNLRTEVYRGHTPFRVKPL